MPYEYLEDEAIADIAIMATGNSLVELFRDTAMAVINLQTNIKNLTGSQIRSIKLSAKSKENLLYQLLDEIIFLKDADLYFPTSLEIDVKEQSDSWELQGSFRGIIFDYTIHEMGNDIKAITLHDFYIKKQNDKWLSHVIIDI